MPDDTNPGTAFRSVLAAIKTGDFNKTKKGLESLGFNFKQGSDACHFTYWHQELLSDPVFRYPRILNRPHGKNRDSRITDRDQGRATQIVRALQAVRESTQEEED